MKQKIALAYSGGLDTSIIIQWLKDNYHNADIYCVSMDVGQEEDWDAIRDRALRSGAKKIEIVDAKEEFLHDYVFPLLRSGALYEGRYLLGTAIARPLQAKKHVEFALKEGASILAHGCTGRGNDQVRFEVAYRALAPQLDIIAPWRIWDIKSREDAIAYAASKHIPIGDVSKKNIYSRDWNILHMSHEGGMLEDSFESPEASMFRLTRDRVDAPDRPEDIEIEFKEAIPVRLNGKTMTSMDIFIQLNKIGSLHGIGRTDIIESRIVGMKSRGVYETPAGTILYHALRDLEAITLDKESLSAKQTIAIRYAELVYGGLWFSLLRESYEAFMQHMGSVMSGRVHLSLYKGSIQCMGRDSAMSLYKRSIASFDRGEQDHSIAAGFIELYALPSKVHAWRINTQRPHTAE